jgi:hypothetical protein
MINLGTNESEKIFFDPNSLLIEVSKQNNSIELLSISQQINI